MARPGLVKPHTMGTAYLPDVEDSEAAGIIPLAIQDIFDGVTNQTDNEYLVEESFIELYKETLFDLLNNKNDKEECSVDIREDARGGIKIICITDILHQR